MHKIDPAIPFNNLPNLPPNVDLETKHVMRKLAGARAALAEMKGIGEIIPNQAMLINTLTMREAKDSSEIENIVTTQDELYIAFATQQKSINSQIKEVLNYREALWFGFNLIKKIKESLEEAIERIKTELPSVYSKDLVETIFEQPYCKVSSIVSKGLYERRTAMKYLRQLERIGLLKAVPSGNQVLFLNIKLYELLKQDSV
ncbi:Fic/DOC family N-terminal domain-containing protein [Fulvivirgaceae bacterium BMA10]|uniref:Fic/DOC family N-terminal domain-containing protein n=1 Tax=Splendidivirga corallicola TaxID=3051826 RepID=A0ABT8KML2_9BACT|nr:Fic/DOC family N-terminal domain-containing protein [Fulvivirgaceae bacterium BMA10]